jgi:acetyl esterase
MASRISSARKRAGAALVDGFFNGVSRLAKLHPKARPERHGIAHIKDIRYLEGSTEAHHLLDVYKPANASAQPWPIVFYIHGGSFRILSKDTHWVMGLGFARAGYLVFNISYRLAPQHRYPAAVEDVCHAFAWAMKNAARFGGDTSRVVLAGESAGANLATALSIALAYERPEPFAKAAFETGIVPRAVLPACGVFQVSDLGRLKRRKAHMSQFIADRISELEAAYLGPEPTASLDLVDTAVFFERGEKPARPLPPFFLPVGTRDPLLPDTRRLADALTAMGVETEARYYPNELHAFHAFVMRKAARECWRDTYRFLERHVPQTK